MTFLQFLQTMIDAESKFTAAVADFPEHADFLLKSQLVVTIQSSQFSFKKSLSVADITERILLVKESDFKDNFLFLNKQLKDAQASAKKAQGQEGTRLKEKIKKLEEARNSFPIEEELEFHTDFNVEVRFPSVNIEIIQMLKAHPLVNQTKTSMSKASIRVYFY